MKIQKIEIRKDRIALLVDTWFPVYSGEQIHAAKLAEALAAEYGWEVDILTCGVKEGLRREEKILDKTNGVRVRRICKYRWLYPFALIGHLILHRKRYKILHAHTTLSAAAMKVGSWFMNAHTIVTVHGNRVMERGWTLRKLIDRVVFLETRYSQEISVSESFLKARNVNDHVLVIPHGIDTEPFDAVKPQREPEKFRVLFVGRLAHDKGLDLLLKATRELVDSSEFIQSRKDFVLNIVGPGKDEKVLKELAAKLDLTKYVKFHGKVTGETLLEFYKSSDLFVLPSRFEGLPMTLLEACAAKLPILATNVGDMRRLVLENVNGHLIQSEDVQELSYYLAHFAMNPGLEQMGQASYEIVQQEYNWETTIKKILRVYEALGQKQKSDVIMPWHLPIMLWKARQYDEAASAAAAKGAKTLARKKTPLKFCLTANVEQAYAALALPHEVEHIPDFVKRFLEFGESMGAPCTAFFQDDLFEPFLESVMDTQDAGHEIGVRGEQKNLRGLKDDLTTLKMKGVRLFRPINGEQDGSLKYIHELGFDQLPTSEDPMPNLHWLLFVPYARPRMMNLRSFLAMSEEELLASINRLRAYQHEHGIDPFLIFECSSWEFQSRDHAPWASGENFTELAKRLAFLQKHMDIQFMTLSEFCRSCSMDQN